MALLFKRNAALILSVKGKPTATKITRLRITFDIVKDGGSNPNTATVNVYNISSATRALLESDEELFATLEVGYGENLDTLFEGDITKSAYTRQGADWITSLELGDGDQSLREANFDQSYIAGTDIKTIITDGFNKLVEKGKVVFGASDEIESKTTQTGITVSGLAKDTLDILVNDQGLEWSIQDNETQIIKKGGDTGEVAIKLSPSTGLIGSPTRREEGIAIKSLIQTTRFRPGRKISLESRSIKGTFTIQKVEFSGDTHGDPWYATCEAL